MYHASSCLRFKVFVISICHLHFHHNFGKITFLVINFISDIFSCLMELLTAVLSGDRCLELRVFGSVDYLQVCQEQNLTRRLCLLMDRYCADWKRLV